MWEVCKASSAAPTYFPAHILNLGGADVPLIDGGVFANNPTAGAIAEGVRINKALGNAGHDLDEFVVASFGTGEATRPIEAKQALQWGALEWAVPIVDDYGNICFNWLVNPD